MQRRTVAVLDAQDPIEKLKALAALEKAATVDEKGLRAGFVEHARGWAEANGISVHAFRELKVPDDVLGAAGFDVKSLRARKSVTAAVASAESTSRRRPAVSATEIKEAVLTLAEPFTLNEVMAKVGRQPHDRAQGRRRSHRRRPDREARPGARPQRPGAGAHPVRRRARLSRPPTRHRAR